MIMLSNYPPYQRKHSQSQTCQPPNKGFLILDLDQIKIQEDYPKSESGMECDGQQIEEIAAMACR